MEAGDAFSCDEMVAKAKEAGVEMTMITTTITITTITKITTKITMTTRMDQLDGCSSANSILLEMSPVSSQITYRARSLAALRTTVEAVVEAVAVPVAAEMVL
jgi:hypothetical protein